VQARLFVSIIEQQSNSLQDRIRYIDITVSCKYFVKIRVLCLKI